MPCRRYLMSLKSIPKISLRPSRQAIKRAALALALRARRRRGCGLRPQLLHHRPLPGIDRRRLCEGRTPRSIAPKVSGYIAEVLVGDNQPVKAGQLLARIDDRDFRTALDQAHADVAAAEAAVRNLDAQIALQQPVIEQEHRRRRRPPKPTLKFAQEEQARYDGLMKTGSGTVQRAQQTDAALRAADRAIAARASPACSPPQQKVDVLSDRTRQGGRAARSRPRRRAAGGAQSVLHADHRAGRRHRRRALAAGRPISCRPARS